jgi:hypothetical protein
MPPIRRFVCGTFIFVRPFGRTVTIAARKKHKILNKPQKPRLHPAQVFDKSIATARYTSQMRLYGTMLLRMRPSACRFAAALLGKHEICCMTIADSWALPLSVLGSLNRSVQCLPHLLAVPALTGDACTYWRCLHLLAMPALTGDASTSTIPS